MFWEIDIVNSVKTKQSNQPTDQTPV